MSDKYIVELNRDIADLTHCLAEKDKELKTLRAWKAEAKPFLERQLHLVTNYPAEFYPTYVREIPTLTELLEEET